LKPTALPFIQVLLAAALFGASAPLAKLLLDDVQPVMLAALLYLGSGIGLAVLRLVLNLTHKTANREARIERADLPWLGGAYLAGGVLAPILLLISLERTPAATASLLLNFEAAATTLIAVLVFREAIGKHVMWAIGLITAASILLSWEPNGWGFSLGALGVAGACFLWGLDNNLTRHISAKDPLSIVMWKGIGAGITSLMIATILGQPLPRVDILAASLLLGFFSYGFSIVLFIRAMRALGAARTSALFAAAPFVGAAIAVLVFREAPHLLFFLALPLMMVGAYQLFQENHEHAHEHPTFEHEHSHTHTCRHHIHEHGEDLDRAEEWHCHRHIHQPMKHAHAHAPDIHHRHEHQEMEVD
jgi:drug/metabolite transporter (DMT)-like permease